MRPQVLTRPSWTPSLRHLCPAVAITPYQAGCDDDARIVIDICDSRGAQPAVPLRSQRRTPHAGKGPSLTTASDAGGAGKAAYSNARSEMCCEAAESGGRNRRRRSNSTRRRAGSRGRRRISDGSEAEDRTRGASWGPGDRTIGVGDGAASQRNSAKLANALWAAPWRKAASGRWKPKGAVVSLSLPEDSACKRIGSDSTASGRQSADASAVNQRLSLMKDVAVQVDALPLPPGLSLCDNEAQDDTVPEAFEIFTQPPSQPPSPSGVLASSASECEEPLSPVQGRSSLSFPDADVTVTSWDWPLSRHERKARLLLVEKTMDMMDKDELLKELEELRTTLRRRSDPVRCKRRRGLY